MDETGIQTFLIISSVIAFGLALAVILLFAIFQKRKNKLLTERRRAEKRFQEEITETQIEIKEETLRNISWELHDNIGQLMTLAKIQLQNANNDPERMEEAVQTLGKSLTELRSLSKSINPASLSNLTLVQATELEIGRFNRLNYLEATLKVTGEEFPLDNKVEIIIFRMLQEFFTNTVKHSKASQLNVSLNYTEDTLHIEAKDNGIGFDTTQKFPDRGIGLGNIKNRALLIGAKAEINSTIGEGTELLLTYKIERS